MRTPTPFQSLTAPRGFLAAQLGPGWSAPFGGFSWKMLEAFTALVNAWYAADSRNRRFCEQALRPIVLTFPDSQWDVLKAIIYGLGYEGAIGELWPLIVPPA